MRIRAGLALERDFELLGHGGLVSAVQVLAIAFSSEVGSGSRKENALKK
jgi:hypothetical protein